MEQRLSWLPALSNGWSFVPVGWLGRRTQVKNTCLREKNLLSLSYGKVIRKDISSGEGLRPASYETYQIVEPGDTVLRFTDLQNDKRSLRSGLVTERGIVTSAYINFRPNPALVDPRFFAFMMRTVDQKKIFYQMGSGVRQSLNYDEFSTLAIPLPDLGTQRRIADYLETETAQITCMVAKLDEQVELLRDRKLGLFDSMVPRTGAMEVASDIVKTVWFGDIPQRWRRSRVGLVGTRRQRKNNGMLEQNLLSLSYGRIVPKDIKNKEGLVPASYESYQIVEPGDIVLRFTDLQNDKKSLRSGLVKERGIITSAYVAFRPNTAIINPEFFACVMRLVDLRKVFYQMGSGVRQTLNYDEFSTLEIPLPPLDEQCRIVAELDEKTARIDTMIDKCTQLRELLHERRAALITAVVTGQKEV